MSNRNPDNPQFLTSADFRRATALMRHSAAGSAEGIRFCLDEAAELGRSTHLLRGLLAGYGVVATELRTEAGLEGLWATVEAIAAREDQYGAAATIVLAHRDADLGAFNAGLVRANDAEGGPGSLVAAVLQLWAGLLPELASPPGLDGLARWTARIAERDDAGPGNV